MASETIKCPSCHRDVESGKKFCPGCGTRMEQAPAAVRQPFASPASAPPAPAPSASMPSPPCDCDSPTMLDIDRLSVLFDGCPSTVRFRVNPSSFGEGARDFRIAFEDQFTGVRSRAVRPRGPCGAIHEFGFTFPEKAAGSYVWYVAVDYECGGRRHVREGEVHLVVERPQDAQKVVDNLVVTINNNITTGHATDVVLNQSAADALDRISKSAENPFASLRRLMGGKERAWTRVDLYETDAAPAQQPAAAPPPPSPAQITLKGCGEALQLTSLRTLTFGKTRERNDYALRVYDEGGAYDIERSRAISRTHLRMSCGNGGCYLEDMNSTYGTTLDGAAVSGGKVLVSPGKAHVVRLSERFAPGGVLALTVRVFAAAGRAPSGMVIDRCDGARQRIFALWDEAGVPADAGGWSFRLKGGRMEIRSPDGTSSCVVPGESVRIGSRTFAAGAFSQPFAHENG